jgi:hypothetical protein
MTRREKQLQKDINNFLSIKLDPFLTKNINLFNRIFEPFKIKDGCYILDGLDNEQRKLFIEYYIGFSGGGGIYTFNLNIQYNIYRIEFRNLFGNFILINTNKEQD